MVERKARIMVVDDDPAMLLSICDILEFEDYDVEAVKDGFEALEKASAERFDLVLMDINMPGMNGVDAFRKIRLISPTTVVVMMTGFSVEDLVEQALNEGAYTVLYKPLDIKNVLATVHTVVDASCILVVDDEPDNRESLQMVLEDTGIRVALAENGKQAVEKVQENHFDIVLMDVGMPGMDAFEACERIVEMDPRVKVIFVTAHELEEYSRKALSAGAFSLLSKPVEPDDMVTLVNSIVNHYPEANPESIGRAPAA